MAPSRQERRRAERDASKRAPAQAGALGAAAARADVNVNPVGDWTTQASDPFVLFRTAGANIVKQRAGAGDREAQWSLGYHLMWEVEGFAFNTRPRTLGAAGRSPKADVGLAVCNTQYRVAQHTATVT